MVITTAHIPAIVALIAGVLILIMPRFLNFMVAIYLIFIGLIGLGVLRMVPLCSARGRAPRLARNPPKWCKARNFSFPLADYFASHGQSRSEAQENRSEIKVSVPARAKAAPSATPARR